MPDDPAFHSAYSRRELMRNPLAVLAACLVITLAGCHAKKPESAIFLRQDLDLAAINRVAVLPFENLTGTEYSARLVREMFITELVAARKFEVVDKEAVDGALDELTSNSGSLHGPVLKILAKKLEVDAFLSGSLNRIGGRGWGKQPYPEVPLTLNLIDGESLRVLWRSTAYHNAYMRDRTAKDEPRGERAITLKLLRDMIAAIPK